jgi:LysR family hydrogen peroxide-inducible transcriptional activator
MNIRDLKYIIAVAKEQHFAKAAELSNVSQPALSMQIKKLEDELEVQIFERSQKNFLVTEAGKQIINKAEEVLQKIDDLRKLAKNSRNPFGGELRIGAFPTLAAYYFPKIIGKISKKFPQLKLLLVEEKTAVLVEKLKAGELDLALIAMPHHDKDLQGEKIFSEDFLLAVNKKHRLNKEKKITQKNLHGEEIMLLEDGHCLRDQALEVCSMMGTSENQTFRATSLETLKQMIANNSGITLIPEIAATKHEKISYLKIANSPTRTVGLFWRKSFARKGLAEGIVGVIRK